MFLKKKFYPKPETHLSAWFQRSKKPSYKKKRRKNINKCSWRRDSIPLLTKKKEKKNISKRSWRKNPISIWNSPSSMVLEVQGAFLQKKKKERMLVNILEEEILSQFQNSSSIIVPEIQGVFL